MDRRSVYSAHVFEPSYAENGDTRLQLLQQLETFILDFRLDNNFVYRDQLRENALLKQYYCDVKVNDLINFNEELAHKLASEPAEVIPLFEAALKKCTHRIVFPHEKEVNLPDHQLLLHSDAEDVSIRNLDSMTIARLVRVPVSSLVLPSCHPKPRSCTSSAATVNSRRSSPCWAASPVCVTLPRQCNRKRIDNDPTPKCPLDPYFVMHEKSQFVDQQIIKLQEAPDQVPVGELPRHVLISADRYLTNRVVPGSRCTVMGIFSIYQNKASKKSSTTGAVAIRTPYLRAVGIQTDLDQTAKGHVSYSEEEEQEFLEMSRRPDLYNVMADCIAPSIYGNRDIKKAILCLLLGGSKKILPDGMKLRGDINVLLLGDPGTAKSQLLKFVEKAAPISIYTSGKGSSAAGLTASVQRDHSTREFYLEGGGAMVLADGGVVCIDEFDKMRDDDRVAIHEAMEQQTISIAKAGITTILNARTSVLAAANPIFGRYDDMKTPGENIDFQTTILSRFDMIFIVKDEHTREKDERIAKHVMGIHMDGRGTEEVAESEIPVEKMRRYITYCKTRCAPRLSPEAAEKRSRHHWSPSDVKSMHAELEANTRPPSNTPSQSVSIEAIVPYHPRIPRKLTLSSSPRHGRTRDEAIRLFLCSTMDAVNQGSNQGSRELNEEVNRLEVRTQASITHWVSTSLAT
ncbi:minichromosome maintenance protein 5 [Metarhizium acridum]|nr:minichromosome maintenance protein 5 [Metarhizium acridum]